MKRFIILAGLIILLFLVLVGMDRTSLSLAEIPRLINYQGMLTDDSGDPITDTLNLQFRIYNSETNGDLKWSETQNQVPIIDGLFNVILGSENPVDTLSFSEEYWLEVQVDDDTMPRIRFTSVGYAYRALIADSALATAPAAGSHWSVVDSVLYTSKYWGIARGEVGNKIYGDSLFTNVNLGVACTTGKSGNDRYYCTVSGGVGNVAAGTWSTVGGGIGNRSVTDYTSIGGGNHNVAYWHHTTVGGGGYNFADGSYATIGGGYGDSTDGYSATVGGGYSNKAGEDYATVGGGYHNRAEGNGATVGGGAGNIASGKEATVPGGRSNTASANQSFAAGYQAKANHTGTFVWADSSGIEFASTDKNQFLIRASGGVGIGTTNPLRELHIAGAGYTEIMLEKTDATTNQWHIGLDAGRLDFVETDVDERMTLEDGGNVGIGTTDPEEKLHVWWDTNVDAELGRGVSDTDITYLALRNANGTKCYIYPNADGNGIVVSTTKP